MLLLLCTTCRLQCCVAIKADLPRFAKPTNHLLLKAMVGSHSNALEAQQLSARMSQARHREATLAATKPYLTVVVVMFHFPRQFSFCWTPDAVRLFKPPHALPGKKKSTASYKQNKSYTRLKCEDCFDSWLFHGLGCSWLTGFSVKIKLEFFLSIIYLHIYFTWSDHVRGN